MRIKILKEAGYEEALYGLALSYKKNPADMVSVLPKLVPLDNGHNKALEHIMVWLSIQAPLDWWIQFDTYRVGVSKQSESTMHTLKSRHLTQEDFEEPILPAYLEHLNSCIDGNMPISKLKKKLPCGFLQEREVVLSYKVIRHIMKQRGHHKLEEWKVFCNGMKSLEHFELIGV